MFDLDFEQFIFRLKIFSAILSLIFTWFFIYFFSKFRKMVGLKFDKLRASVKLPEPAAGGALQSRWNEVVSHIESAREAEWKLAVIEADKLADDTLKTAGFPGDSMGERLMNIERGRLQSLEGLWDAHKIRNKLVHDVGYFLRYAEARRAVQLYEKALRELGAL